MLLQQLFTALTALTAAQLRTNFEFDAKDQVQTLVNHKLLHLVFCIKLTAFQWISRARW